MQKPSNSGKHGQWTLKEMMMMMMIDFNLCYGVFDNINILSSHVIVCSALISTIFFLQMNRQEKITLLRFLHRNVT